MKLYPPGFFFHFRVLASGLAGCMLLTLATKPLPIGLGIFAAAFSLYMIWAGWVMYVIDGEGIAALRLTGKQHWRWTGLTGIARTRMVEHEHIGLEIATDRIVPAFQSGSTYTRRDVIDVHGHLAFRMSPWPWSRADVAEQIRRLVRAAHND